MFENALQFVGAFVAFSIALVAYKGVRETSSSSMLRLAAAFVFLGSGFVLEGLEGSGRLRRIPGLRCLPRDHPDRGDVPADRRLLLPGLLPRPGRRVSPRVGPSARPAPDLRGQPDQRRDGPAAASRSTSSSTGCSRPALRPTRRTRNPNTLFIAAGLGMLAAVGGSPLPWPRTWHC